VALPAQGDPIIAFAYWKHINISILVMQVFFAASPIFITSLDEENVR
jgi:hypothetical protein